MSDDIDPGLDPVQERQRRRAASRAGVTAALFGLLFAVLGSMVGSAIQRGDGWALVRAGAALVLVAGLYWQTVLRPRRG